MKRHITTLAVISFLFILSFSALAGPPSYETIEDVTLTVESRGMYQEGGQLYTVQAVGDYTLLKSDLTSVGGYLSTNTDWTINFQMVVAFDGSTLTYTYEYPNWISELEPTGNYWQNYDDDSFFYFSPINERTHQHLWWYGQGQ